MACRLPSPEAVLVPRVCEACFKPLLRILPDQRCGAAISSRHPVTESEVWSLYWEQPWKIRRRGAAFCLEILWIPWFEFEKETRGDAEKQREGGFPVSRKRLTRAGTGRGCFCREPTRGVRRGFLKATVSAGASAPLLLSSVEEAHAFSLFPTPEVRQPDRIVPTFCEPCFWNCGLRARVQKNRVLSLEGHPDYPTSRGRLCGRGNAGAGFLRDGDRLKYPMVRTGKRGEGRFERVGWNTAYRVIAEGFERR